MSSGPFSTSQTRTRYFDSDLNEVKTAAKPGRYAAVVHIESDPRYGLSCDRIMTLYRPEGKIDWWMGEWPTAGSFTLPKEFGIAQDVVAKQSRELMQVVRGAWSEQSRRDDWLAIVLAGMKETPADAPAYVWRTGPEARNDAFHQALRGKLGMLKHYQYLTYLPAGYEADKDKKYPLLVYLHGAGTRGDDLKEVERSGLSRIWKERPEFPAIVIAPQCPKGEWWTPLVLNSLVDEAMAKYRVDTSRLYMTGLSMGGFGTWNYAVCFPERLAAIAPICGIGDDRDMARLKDVPAWVFHGDADTVVAIEPDRKCVDALKAAGGDVTFTIYPGVGHDAWTAAYATPELYKWMASKRRK